MTRNDSPQRTLDDFIDAIQEQSEDHERLLYSFQQAWGDMIRVYLTASPPKTDDDVPLAPSSEAIAFAMRAWSNPHYRALMERLADE